MPNNQIKTSALLGLSVATAGVIVLLGWQFNIAVFRSPVSSIIPINIDEALVFVLLGVIIYLTTKNNDLQNHTRNIIFGSAGIIICYTIYSCTLKLSLLSINFFLLGSAVVLTNLVDLSLKKITNYLSAAVFITGLFYTFPPVYFVPELEVLLKVFPLPIYAALLLQPLALAIMLLNKEYGFMREINAVNQMGGKIKYLFPATVFFPYAFSILLFTIWFSTGVTLNLIVVIGVTFIMSAIFLFTIYVSFEFRKINTKRDLIEKELLDTNLEFSLSNDRFFKFFKSSPVATNIVKIQDGKFVHVNHAFLKLFSFTYDEVIGKTSIELNIINAELSTRIIKKAREINYEVQNTEIELRDKKGNYINILSSTQPIELNGEPHMLNTLVDITERKRFEEELIKSRKSLNDAQRLSKTGSWEFNLKTQALFWSEELYTLFELEQTPADELYEACRRKMHPNDINNLDDAIKLAQEKGETIVYEHRVFLNNGNVRYLLGLGEIINNEEGKPEWLRGTTQDITERKIFEEKLRQYNIQLDLKNKELEQFAFIASHDLQEPLRTISSFTELLTDEYSSKFDNNANTYVRFIAQSAIRMRDLISGLLEYSRLGSKIILQETDCNQILRNTLENLHAAIKESGAIITIEQLPVIKAYPLELELLFQNLISNSIKFRKRDVVPEIDIKAEKKNNQWIFSIADNGIGIDQKYFEKIFLLFQRLHSRDNYEGSGIGLSHCKKIVELHNGKIWIESKSGEGSVFYFTIPEYQN